MQARRLSGVLGRPCAALVKKGLTSPECGFHLESRAEPSRAEPSRAEPSRAEPSRAEPSRAEPSRAEAMTAPRAQHRPPSPPDRRPSPRGGHPSSQTASAAARPAGFARLAGARRGLVHSARPLAAVALLALAAALALPATAQAQTPTTFVSNLGQTDTSSNTISSPTSPRAQQFETGSNSGGYTLTEIVVNIRGARTGTPAFALYTSTAADRPDTKVVDLNGNSSTAGEQSFSPASTTLSARRPSTSSCST